MRIEDTILAKITSTTILTTYSGTLELHIEWEGHKNNTNNCVGYNKHVLGVNSSIRE